MLFATLAHFIHRYGLPLIAGVSSIRDSNTKDMSEEFKNLISEKVKSEIDKHNLELVNSDFSGMGELREYSSENLYIRVVNDRGIFDIEVGSVFNNDNLRCVSFFKDWLSPPMKGRWNLSIEQQLEYLSENWDWFNRILAESNHQSSIENLDKYLNERV